MPRRCGPGDVSVENYRGCIIRRKAVPHASGGGHELVIAGLSISGPMNRYGS